MICNKTYDQIKHKNPDLCLSCSVLIYEGVRTSNHWWTTMTFMQTVTHQSKCWSVISHYLCIITFQSKAWKIFLEKLMSQEMKQDSENGKTTSNIVAKTQQKKQFLSTPILLPPFKPLPPHTLCPLTQPVWNWKTQIWKWGNLYGLTCPN